MSECVYIGVGANLGDARKTLDLAFQALTNEARISQLHSSSYYVSAPIDSSGDDYINAVFCFKTTLRPHELLDLLQRIENRFGRERPYQNAPRTLDLDILLYGSQVIQDDRLSIPHPRMHQRAFVLLPLIDLSPEIRIPALGSAQDFLSHVTSQEIKRL